MTRFETRRADWISVERALHTAVSVARPLPGETVPLSRALGRALAVSIEARATLPPWDNSAMDGYAVRGEDVAGASADAPVRLRVVGESRAGVAAGGRLGPGEARRIMTGAPVPAGADSVVRVEDTDREEHPGVVLVRSDRDRDRNVRPGGQDMRRGDVVLEAGTSIGPGQVAVAAAAGFAEVRVHRRPRIAILSSGDELVGPEDYEDVVEGRAIPETNGPAIAAAAAAAGAEAIPPLLARDDPDDIREKVLAAAEADVLVTSGGASMGEADLFKRVLAKEGLELSFWRVTLRPGSPLSLGHLPREGGAPLPVFGLPGNPASAFVTFELFVRPFLLRLAGHRRIHRTVVRATAGEELASTPRLTHFHRVTLHDDGGTLMARLTGPQGSGLVRSLGRADGLAVVPRGIRAIEAGRPVDVILLGDGPAASELPGYRASVE